MTGTQYAIWHKSHTAPAIKMGMPRRGSLLDIDLRALSDLVDTLLRCHVQAGRLSDCVAALERFRANIDDPRWQRKIVYFHAMAALGPHWDEPAGRAQLRKLGAIEEDDDEETIQVYLDLFGDELSFSQKNDLIDRILAQTKKLPARPILTLPFFSGGLGVQRQVAGTNGEAPTSVGVSFCLGCLDWRPL